MKRPKKHASRRDRGKREERFFREHEQRRRQAADKAARGDQAEKAQTTEARAKDSTR